MEIREVFDVKQYPGRSGRIGDLEKRVSDMEYRFAKIYRRENVNGFLGFCTEENTRFFVNGIYEWDSVYLEYADGEDGDMVPMELDEDSMFRELHKEILTQELDDRMSRSNTYRIYKSASENGMIRICFRFPDGEKELEKLFEKSERVKIDDRSYPFQGDAKNRSVLVNMMMPEGSLYDRWLKFE